MACGILLGIVMHRVSRIESVNFFKFIHISEYTTDLVCHAGNRSHYLLTETACSCFGNASEGK